MAHESAIVLDGELEIGHRTVHRFVEADHLEVLAPSAHAGQGQQILDQSLHSGGALHGKGDKLPCVVVQLRAISLRQELGEVGDHAQRLLKVMGSYVGELLQEMGERLQAEEALRMVSN